MEDQARIGFRGVAAYTTTPSSRGLCDPVLDESPGALVDSLSFDSVDLENVGLPGVQAGPARGHAKGPRAADE
jgi:hypothetical protein